MRFSTLNQKNFNINSILVIYDNNMIYKLLNNYCINNYRILYLIFYYDYYFIFLILNKNYLLPFIYRLIV